MLVLAVLFSQITFFIHSEFLFLGPIYTYSKKHGGAEVHWITEVWQVLEMDRPLQNIIGNPWPSGRERYYCRERERARLQKTIARESDTSAKFSQDALFPPYLNHPTLNYSLPPSLRVTSQHIRTCCWKFPSSRSQYQFFPPISNLTYMLSCAPWIFCFPPLLSQFQLVVKKNSSHSLPLSLSSIGRLRDVFFARFFFIFACFFFSSKYLLFF